MARTQRIRRTPTQAREHILDAADLVFSEHLPDAVGLRDIADAAEVSHGLVTHYFKTYDGLVATAIARRIENARSTAFARLASATFNGTDTPLLSIAIDALEDRTLARLLVWSFLTHRGDRIVSAGFAAPIVDALSTRLTALGVEVPRERVERAMMLGVCTLIGWAVLADSLDQIFGRHERMEMDTFRREAYAMLSGYVTTPGSS